MVVNGKNGEVSEVALAPLPGVGDKDREIGKAIGGTTNSAPLYFKGPRRLWADKTGDNVWVAEFWGGQIAKIDIHTRKVTEYKVPSRYSHPYAIVVDKNHMVWICLKSSDRVAKFDPFTEKFTEYPIPSLGTDVRRLDVDNSTNPPTLWIPYTSINKIARMEFRTATGPTRGTPSK
jgi:streptogramin lyase